ncbi:MAG: hypothetical protein IJH80_07740 [Ruminococcus sp.]|nr:hypothetical protein [Ruminococcus sp.]
MENTKNTNNHLLLSINTLLDIVIAPFIIKFGATAIYCFTNDDKNEDKGGIGFIFFFAVLIMIALANLPFWPLAIKRSVRIRTLLMIESLALIVSGLIYIGLHFARVIPF